MSIELQTQPELSDIWISTTIEEPYNRGNERISLHNNGSIHDIAQKKTRFIRPEVQRGLSGHFDLWPMKDAQNSLRTWKQNTLKTQPDNHQTLWNRIPQSDFARNRKSPSIDFDLLTPSSSLFGHPEKVLNKKAGNSPYLQNYFVKKPNSRLINNPKSEEVQWLSKQIFNYNDGFKDKDHISLTQSDISPASFKRQNNREVSDLGIMNRRPFATQAGMQNQFFGGESSALHPTSPRQLQIDLRKRTIYNESMNGNPANSSWQRELEIIAKDPVQFSFSLSSNDAKLKTRPSSLASSSKLAQQKKEFIALLEEKAGNKGNYTNADELLQIFEPRAILHQREHSDHQNLKYRAMLDQALKSSNFDQ